MDKKKIAMDFGFLKKKVLGIAIYGSQASKKATPRSDIDICIIIGKESGIGDMKNVLKAVWRKIDTATKKYDVRLFEELPLDIKADVMKNGIVLIGDKVKISGYFYKFRKMWEDQKCRRRLSK
jgi:predicted nucleotidyltransferase